MKKKFSRSLASMVLCFAMVVGICIVPASALARDSSNSAKVWVNGTEIWISNLSNDPNVFSGELVVVGFDPDNKYYGTKVYGPSVGGNGESFRPGTYYTAFLLDAPSSDDILELRIEFLLSDESVGQSITVSYDIRNDTLTVLKPTSRKITVDQVEISFIDFSYYDNVFCGEMYVNASNNPTYDPYYIQVNFSPDLGSVGGMLKPGGSFATFALSGTVGDVTYITYKITLYSQDYQNLLEIFVKYDVTRNDFIYLPV